MLIKITESKPGILKEKMGEWVGTELGFVKPVAVIDETEEEVQFYAEIMWEHLKFNPFRTAARKQVSSKGEDLENK